MMSGRTTHSFADGGEIFRGRAEHEARPAVNLKPSFRYAATLSAHRPALHPTSAPRHLGSRDYFVSRKAEARRRNRSSEEIRSPEIQGTIRVHQIMP
jgi:hypothetical protein